MMKRFLISSIIFPILILTSCLPPAGSASAPTTTSASSETPSLPPTEAPTPTPAETQLPKKYTQEEINKMTPEQKLAASPEIEGLIKSNVSTVKDELVIYRDENENAIKVFDLLTAKELTLQEAGIAELDLTDGTKWEMQLFTNSQEALQFIADNAEWFEGDRGEVGLKLKQEGKLEKLLQKNKAIKNINVNSGSGHFPPFQEKTQHFFDMFIWEGPNGGLILSFLIDKNGNFDAIFLDDPSILGNSSLLTNEIRKTEFAVPEN